MSTDNPPNNYFNGIGYNPLFYVKDTGTGLTQAQIDLLYLSKKIQILQQHHKLHLTKRLIF